MRLLAGLDRADAAARSRSAGTAIDGPSSEVGAVFQQATLLPWLTVWQNVTLPLRVGGHAIGEREGPVRELLKIAALQGFENKYPYESSGRHAAARRHRPRTVARSEAAAPWTLVARRTR